MTEWNKGDRFNVSGTVQLSDCCPRVKTSGTIVDFKGTKQAIVMLDKVDNESNVEAIVKLRDIRPLVKGAVKAAVYIKGTFETNFVEKENQEPADYAEWVIAGADFGNLRDNRHDRFRISKHDNEIKATTTVRGIYDIYNIKASNLETMVEAAEKAYHDAKFGCLMNIEIVFVNILTD